MNCTNFLTLGQRKDNRLLCQRTHPLGVAYVRVFSRQVVKIKNPATIRSVKLGEKPTRIRRPTGTSCLKGEQKVKEVFRLDEYVQPDDYFGLAEELKRREISPANETRFALLLLGQQKKDYLKFSAWERTDAQLREYEVQLSQDPKNMVINDWLSLAGRAAYLFPGKRDRLLNRRIIQLCDWLVLNNRLNQIDLALLMPENKEEFGVNEAWAEKVVETILMAENILLQAFCIQAICLFFPDKRVHLTVLLPKLKQQVRSDLLILRSNKDKHSSSIYSIHFRMLSLIRLISAESINIDQTEGIQVVDVTRNIKPEVELPQRSIY